MIRLLLGGGPLGKHFVTRDLLLRELSRTPKISVPAIAYFLLGVIIISCSSILALKGYLPLWAGMIFNGFGLYLFFTIMHESLHENVSSNKHLNDILGRIALFFEIPFAPLELARWIHLSHHGHTGCKKDPDNFMHHGKWWVLPLRWSNFDLYYAAHFVNNLMSGDKTAQRYASAVGVYVTLLFCLSIAIINFGYGLELFYLWFLSSRIGLGLVGFIFVFLPHHPAKISAHENKYLATTVRRGHEWLLTPLMAYHNYHLIHHLYPSVPFYNYLKIWYLRYEELTSKNPATQTAFGLKPLN